MASSTAALSELWAELQRAAGATERLVELLNAEDTVVDPETPKAPIVGPIKFENVSFSFPTRPDVSALNKVSFIINPGETVALVGPSGAGKSTIIQMLQRFFDPQFGKISFGDVDLSEMDRSAFRKFMSIVPQDPVIFASSAYDNILFGRPGAERSEVVQAAKSAAAHDFISELPNGYESFVGERGVMLSGGQKQRIAIARAILRDAPVLLLDEATSALDTATEVGILQSLQEVAEGRTAVFVAHRLSTVRSCDKIVVMENGVIVEQGTHEDLMLSRGEGDKSGVYAAMWASQQAEIESEQALAEAKQKSELLELELK